MKEFDVVEGGCAVEVTSSRRSTNSVLHMRSTNEQFTFDKSPRLDAYGKAIVYNCEVTVTKDREWPIDYINL